MIFNRRKNFRAAMIEYISSLKKTCGDNPDKTGDSLPCKQPVGHFSGEHLPKMV